MAITQNLIDAIIHVESGGDDFAVGDRTLEWSAYGPMQIRWPVVSDVNRIYGTDYRARMCKGNRPLSIEIFKKYMAIYVTPKVLGRPVTDEDMARCWNGGPSAWNPKSRMYKATNGYWAKVKRALGS